MNFEQKVGGLLMFLLHDAMMETWRNEMQNKCRNRFIYVTYQYKNGLIILFTVYVYNQTPRIFADDISPTAAGEILAEIERRTNIDLEHTT